MRVLGGVRERKRWVSYAGCQPTVFLFLNIKLNSDSFFLCVFSGHWSTDGCDTNNTGTEFVCSCNHLSFFAVLVVNFFLQNIFSQCCLIVLVLMDVQNNLPFKGCFQVLMCLLKSCYPKGLPAALGTYSCSTSLGSLASCD